MRRLRGGLKGLVERDMVGISFNGFVLLHGMDTENSWVHVLGFGLSFIYLFDLWIFFRTPGGWNGYEKVMDLGVF